VGGLDGKEKTRELGQVKNDYKWVCLEIFWKRATNITIWGEPICISSVTGGRAKMGLINRILRSIREMGVLHWGKRK